MIYAKVWRKEIASSTTRNFDINGQFYLTFLKVENLYLYFWVMLKPVSFLFYRENIRERVFFSKFQRTVISYCVVAWISFLFYFETFK